MSLLKTPFKKKNLRNNNLKFSLLKASPSGAGSSSNLHMSNDSSPRLLLARIIQNNYFYKCCLVFNFSKRCHNAEAILMNTVTKIPVLTLQSLEAYLTNVLPVIFTFSLLIILRKLTPI